MAICTFMQRADWESFDRSPAICFYFKGTSALPARRCLFISPQGGFICEGKDLFQQVLVLVSPSPANFEHNFLHISTKSRQTHKCRRISANFRKPFVFSKVIIFTRFSWYEPHTHFVLETYCSNLFVPNSVISYRKTEKFHLCHCYLLTTYKTYL